MFRVLQRNQQILHMYTKSFLKWGGALVFSILMLSCNQESSLTDNQSAKLSSRSTTDESSQQIHAKLLEGYKSATVVIMTAIADQTKETVCRLNMNLSF